MSALPLAILTGGFVGTAASVLFCSWPAICRRLRDLRKTPAELGVEDAMARAR